MATPCHTPLPVTDLEGTSCTTLRVFDFFIIEIPVFFRENMKLDRNPETRPLDASPPPGSVASLRGNDPCYWMQSLCG
jgi:hypothetical protein